MIQRTGIRRKTLVRQWQDAIEKVESEEACRVCGATDFVDAAHILGRKYDRVVVGPRGGKKLYVDPRGIIPLCGAFSKNFHHGLYDQHQLDLTNYLTEEEIAFAIAEIGAGRAFIRISGAEVF